jgi:hypothetical protein
VYTTLHRDDVASTAVSVHDGPANVPCESELKRTDPVGATAGPPPVSVTVARQLAEFPTVTVGGRHDDTDVDVARLISPPPAAPEVKT